MTQLTHGSLFAGIGGFDLGFTRAGIKTVWQVEIDPFCRKVLKRHFPEATCYEDIRRLNHPTYVDIISGGFPCQDISNAGKRVGIDGERSGLWAEMFRIICEIRPKFIVVENVSALLQRGVERVLGDLAAGGFDAEWDCIPASAIGAPHRRDRVWIVAYPTSPRRNGAAREEQHVLRSSLLPTRPSNGGPMVAYADSGRCQQRDKGERSISVLEPCGSDAADPECVRSEKWLAGSLEGTEGHTGKADNGDLQGCRPRNIEAVDWWSVEPEVGRLVNGVSGRVAQLRALGNSLVPQIAEWIGRRIVAACEADS